MGKSGREPASDATPPVKCLVWDLDNTYRFAGFNDGFCACRAELPATDGVELLHLEPTKQQPPTHLSVFVSVLHEPGSGPVRWESFGTALAPNGPVVRRRL